MVLYQGYLSFVSLLGFRLAEKGTFGALSCVAWNSGQRPAFYRCVQDAIRNSIELRRFISGDLSLRLCCLRSTALVRGDVLFSACYFPGDVLFSASHLKYAHIIEAQLLITIAIPFFQGFYILPCIYFIKVFLCARSCIFERLHIYRFHLLQAILTG